MAIHRTAGLGGGQTRRSLAQNFAKCEFRCYFVSWWRTERTGLVLSLQKYVEPFASKRLPLKFNQHRYFHAEHSGLRVLAES